MHRHQLLAAVYHGKTIKRKPAPKPEIVYVEVEVEPQVDLKKMAADADYAEHRMEMAELARERQHAKDEAAADARARKITDTMIWTAGAIIGSRP
jgi:hypothetical protein